jgi:gas vesicle protein
MTQESNAKPILIATASFVGGVAAGLLFAPKNGHKNRAWLSKKTSNISQWVDKKRNIAADKSNKKFHQLHQNFHNGVKRSIPDFYEATEHINLSDRKLFHE